MLDVKCPSMGFSSVLNDISSSAIFVSSAVSFCFAFPFHFSLSLYPFALFFPFQLLFFFFAVSCHMSLASAIIAFILVVFIAFASPVSLHLTNVAPSTGVCLSADARSESSWIRLGVRNISLRSYVLIAVFAIKAIVPVLPSLIISLYFIFLPQYTYEGVGLDAAFWIRVVRIFCIPHIRFDKATPTLGKRVRNNCLEANVREMEVGIWEFIHMITKSLQCV